MKKLLLTLIILVGISACNTTIKVNHTTLKNGKYEVREKKIKKNNRTLPNNNSSSGSGTIR